MLKLPPLICFNDYKDWAEYVEVLYYFFKKDFIDEKITYLGLKVFYIKDPMYQSKEFTFWHIISEGKVEADRLPDLRRCERICWPKPIIEASADRQVKIWNNIRTNNRGKKQIRICFCFGEWDYLVVLEKRNNYYIFCTAYPVSGGHKSKLKKEFLEFSLKSKHRP